MAVAATGWLGWTASQARAELLAAKAELPAVRSAVLTGDGSAADRLVRIRGHAEAADDLTHDPVWAVAAHLPLAGTPIATTRGMTQAVRGLATDGMPALVEAADTLHPGQLLRGGGKLDVAALAAATPALAAAEESITAERDAVTALESSWLGPVAVAHGELRTELTDLARVSHDAAAASRLVPTMLGGNGTRRYFVAFQNPAEARGTGGLLDAYAIVKADHGTVTIERTGANTQLPAFSGSVTGVDPAFEARYGGTGATSLWLNANLSPNFPDVATTWEAMWFQATGQQLDGAVALTPRALSAVLSATGAVTAPAVGTVDAARIEPLVLHEQYELPALASARKTLMLGVGTATIDALLAGKASPAALLPGLRTAARTGHVQIHSRVPDEQERLLGAGIAGAVTTSTQPFAQAVLVNAGGNKLDSWLGSSLDYRVAECSASGRVATITITLVNDAPTRGLPEYVTVRSDRPPYPTVPGQNRTELQVLVTRDSTLLGATLDGVPLAEAPEPEALPQTLPDNPASGFLQAGAVGGRPAYWLDVELAPGASRTLVLRVQEPPSTQAPLLPIQPMVRDTKVSTHGTCRTGSERA